VIAWLKDLWDALLGRPPRQPPRPAQRPSAAVAAPGGPLVQYKNAPQPGPATQVRYRRESVAVPRLGVHAWARRATPRQKLLVLGALVSLVALGAAAVQRVMMGRTLPMVVHGFWVSDEPRYAGLALELRAHVLAFKTTDTANAVVIRRITEVSSTAEARGTFYRVVYDAEGAPAELRFIVEEADEMFFEHQPQITWRRLSATSTMLPASF
jgi:hypothetical protein